MEVCGNLWFPDPEDEDIRPWVCLLPENHAGDCNHTEPFEES